MAGFGLLAALQKTEAYKTGKIVVVDESKDFKDKIKEIDESIEESKESKKEE